MFPSPQKTGKNKCILWSLNAVPLVRAWLRLSLFLLCYMCFDHFSSSHTRSRSVVVCARDHGFITLRNSLLPAHQHFYAIYQALWWLCAERIRSFFQRRTTLSIWGENWMHAWQGLCSGRRHCWELKIIGFFLLFRWYRKRCMIFFVIRLIRQEFSGKSSRVFSKYTERKFKTKA